MLNLLQRNSLFRNYAIWLPESILVYISGIRFFLNIGICAGTQQIIMEQIQWKLMAKFFFKFKTPTFCPNTTAVDWHLKVKNKKCYVGLIKNYCITVSMQKSVQSINLFSSFYSLIILRSHFWLGTPKNHWNNFLLSWICTTMLNISSFHQFILEMQPILESCDQTAYTHF